MYSFVNVYFVDNISDILNKQKKTEEQAKHMTCLKQYSFIKTVS